MVRAPTPSDESASSDDMAPTYEQANRNPPARRRSVAGTNGSTTTRTNQKITPASFPVQTSPNEDAQSWSDLRKGLKLFRKLLVLDAYRMAKDDRHSLIRLSDRDEHSFPIIRGEAVVSGVTTEEVLGTLLSNAARRQWDVRFQASGVVSLDNGADQGVYVEMHKGIFPDFPPHHFVIARNVIREDPSSANGKITVISKTTRGMNITAPKNSEAGTFDVVGWQLEPIGNNQVKIISISQINFQQDLTASSVLYKILSTECATGPRELGKFIERQGFPPFFVRWMDGPAKLIGDGEGSLVDGLAVFRIDSDGKAGKEPQKCWLQWSDSEEGVHINIDPPSAATLSRVSNVERTAELIWSPSFVGSARIVLQPGDERDSNDIVFQDRQVSNGQLPRVNGVSLEKRPSIKEKATVLIKTRAPVPVNDRTVSEKVAAVPKSQDHMRSIDSPKSASSSPPKGKLEAVKVQEVQEARIPTRTPFSDISGGYQVQSLPSPVPKLGKTLPTSIPQDVCIIVSESLYFTRDQVKIILAVGGMAYLYGKFHG